MTKDSRLNTEAEANAVGVVGAVKVRVAVAVHTAEVGGAAPTRRTLPPPVRRPGAVGEVFDSVRGGSKVAVLRALTGFRVGSRAENLNLGEEEELHRVCVDSRALTACGGLLVDALEHRLQVGRQSRQKRVLQPRVHFRAGKATAIYIRGIHSARSCHKVFHAEGNTGFTAACEVVMIEAHNYERQSLASDRDVLRIADRPKLRSLARSRRLSNLRPCVLREHAVEEQTLDGVGLPGGRDCHAHGVGRLSALCSGNGIGTGRGNRQGEHTARRHGAGEGLRAVRGGNGSAGVRGYFQRSGEVGERDFILLHIVHDNALGSGLAVLCSRHDPCTVPRQIEGHRAGACSGQGLRAAFAGDGAAARNRGNNLRWYADRAELRFGNLAVRAQTRDASRCAFLRGRDIAEGGNLRDRDLLIRVKGRDAVCGGFLRGRNIVERRKLSRRDLAVRAQTCNASSRALLRSGDIVHSGKLSRRDLTVRAEARDASSGALLRSRDKGQTRKLTLFQLAGLVEVRLVLERGVDFIRVLVEVCDVREVFRRRLFQLVVFCVGSH